MGFRSGPHSWTSDLLSLHLGQAIEFFSIAKHKRTFIRNRYYISSIIHSVSSVEAHVSRIAYQMFKNKNSSIYIAEEIRDIPLLRMLNSWQNVQTLDKINLILGILKKRKLDSSLENKFSELNDLRDCLVHGLYYENTYYSYFNSIKDICENDAITALTITFEILKILSVSSFELASVVLERNSLPCIQMISGDITLDQILDIREH